MVSVNVTLLMDLLSIAQLIPVFVILLEILIQHSFLMDQLGKFYFIRSKIYFQMPVLRGRWLLWSKFNRNARLPSWLHTWCLRWVEKWYIWSLHLWRQSGLHWFWPKSLSMQFSAEYGRYWYFCNFWPMLLQRSKQFHWYWTGHDCHARLPLQNLRHKRQCSSKPVSHQLGGWWVLSLLFRRRCWWESRSYRRYRCVLRNNMWLPSWLPSQWQKRMLPL